MQDLWINLLFLCSLGCQTRAQHRSASTGGAYQSEHHCRILGRVIATGFDNTALRTR